MSSATSLCDAGIGGHSTNTGMRSVGPAAQKALCSGVSTPLMSAEPVLMHSVEIPEADIH